MIATATVTATATGRESEADVARIAEDVPVPPRVTATAPSSWTETGRGVITGAAPELDEMTAATAAATAAARVLAQIVMLAPAPSDQRKEPRSEIELAPGITVNAAVIVGMTLVLTPVPPIDVTEAAPDTDGIAAVPALVPALPPIATNHVVVGLLRQLAHEAATAETLIELAILAMAIETETVTVTVTVTDTATATATALSHPQSALATRKTSRNGSARRLRSARKRRKLTRQLRMMPRPRACRSPASTTPGLLLQVR